MLAPENGPLSGVSETSSAKSHPKDTGRLAQSYLDARITTTSLACRLPALEWLIRTF